MAMDTLGLLNIVKQFYQARRLPMYVVYTRVRLDSFEWYKNRQKRQAQQIDSYKVI
jgi:hypothetical protein